MKHLNRNLYLIMMGIPEVLFFSYMIVLYKKGIIEVQDFNNSCIHLAVIVIFGTIITLYKRPKSEKGNEDGFDPCLIEVPHTREGIHFEVITMLILAGAWIMAIATDRFWVFEGFFSYLGPLLMFILTIITITILLGVVYLPAFKTRMRKYTNMKQVGLDIRMYRVLAVEFALFVMMYDLPLGSYDPNCLYIFPGVILVTASFKAHEKRHVRSIAKFLNQTAPLYGYEFLAVEHDEQLNEYLGLMPVPVRFSNCFCAPFGEELMEQLED